MSGHEAGWTVVCQPRNYAEAGMVQGLLEAEGIVTSLRSATGNPLLGPSGAVLVLVPAEEAERATELIAAYLGEPGSELEEILR